MVGLLFVPMANAERSSNASRLDELLDMNLGSLLSVEIATGTPLELRKAPAIASLITAQDIQSMGARTLTEVLNTVPGLQVSRNSQSLSPKFGFRGIVSFYSPQTLLMVNGVSLKSVIRGDNHIFWGEFPIHSISRIEIIRGPHSALYGADAFSGVINIVTYSADELTDSRLGASVGSYGTVNTWLNHSVSWQDWDIAINTEYAQSDGYHGQLDADAQTVIDAGGDHLFDQGELPFNPADVSLAPGYMHTEYHALDLWATAEHPYFTVNIGAQERWHLGSGQGVAEALDPVGKFGGFRRFAQLVVKPIPITNTVNLEANTHYYNSKQKNDRPFQLLPPGTLFGAYPQGMIGSPEGAEYTIKLETQLSYSGLSDHLITIGAGYDKQNLYEVTDLNNFNSDLSPRAEGLVDVSDTADAYIPEGFRENHYLFFQDIYQMSESITLTAGFRYDDYSDFGHTFNPRLALVWSTSDTLTTKFLYGRAFRAPSFAETRVTANPVALGNPDIQPEVIETVEFGVNYLPTSKWEYNANVFHYSINDFITFVADPFATTSTAQNVGKRTGYGLETEVKHHFSPSWQVMANYSYVKATDDTSNQDVGEYPNHTSYVRAQWQSNHAWSGHVQTLWVGERKRAFADGRDHLAGYISVDAGLRYTFTSHNLNVELTGRNLFDDDIRDPSPGSTNFGLTPANIARDIPQPGRTVYLGVQQTF